MPVYGYKEPLPLVSYGNRRAMNPAVMKTAPAIKIGTGVFKFAYNAITGAYIDLPIITQQTARKEFHVP